MRLWLRPEVSSRIGLGHLMRTMAVGEVARKAGVLVTYVPKATGALASVPARYGFDLQEDPGSSWLGEVLADDAVLFDGYGFTAADHRAVSAQGARVGAVDDFGSGRFDVDVLVNPNVARQPRYAVPANAVVLAGPAYALVRGAFRSHRRERASGPGTLLVVLGGSDAARVAPRLLELLARGQPFRRVLLVVGPGADEGQPTKAFDWLEVVRDPLDVAVTFDRADAAVTAAGATTWELLTMGVPIALVQVADNQASIRAVAGLGAALDLGSPSELADRLPAVLTTLADPIAQRTLSATALSVVDGRGADRVFAALVSDRQGLDGVGPSAASHE